MSCESHSHSHSDGFDDHIAPIPTNESQSLRNYIDFDKLTGLNIEQPNDKLQLVFKEQLNKFQLKDFIQSDADSQLIINIPFTGYVKLYSLIVRSSGESANCPKSIKLFKNNNNLDFDNISDTKPTFKFDQPLLGVLNDDDEVNLDENNFVEHYLPRSLFQSTTQLTIFIENNWDDDEDELTRVYYIELRGLFQSPLSKDPIITIYESAANPADHKNLLLNENKNQSNV